MFKSLIKKREPMSINDFLLKKNYIVHDIKDGGKTTIYNKNLYTVLVAIGEKKNNVVSGRVLFEIGGAERFSLSFIPSVTIFEIMLKHSIKTYEN